MFVFSDGVDLVLVLEFGKFDDVVLVIVYKGDVV